MGWLINIVCFVGLFCMFVLLLGYGGIFWFIGVAIVGIIVGWHRKPKEIQNNNDSKYSKGSRVLAMITVILIVALVIAAFVCAIIGSKLYLGLLFAAIIVPCVIYVIIWVRGVLDNAYGRKIVDKKDELTEDVASEEKQDKA